MKISRNSKLNKVTEFVWGRSHDQNLCPYFWKTVFAFVFLPIAIVGYTPPARKFSDVVYDINAEKVHNFAVGFMSLFSAAAILGMLWLLGMTAYLLIGSIFAVYGWAGITILSAIALAFGIAIGAGEYTMEFLNILLAFLEARYHQFCPSLEWTE